MKPAYRELVAASWSLIVLAPAALANEGHSLSFDDALSTIITRTTAVGIQNQAVEQTKAKNLPIRTAILPSVSLTGSETRYVYGGVTDPNYIASGTKAAQIQATVNVFKFGADLANWRAATEDETAQSAQLEATILKAEDSGVELLVTDIQRSLEVDAQRKLVENRKRLSAIGKERFDRGLLPLQESQKLEIDLANAESRMNDAVVLEDAAHAALAAALGQDQVQVAREWPWSSRFARAAGLSQAKLDLERLPAWRTAHSQVAAESERETRDLRSILPTIDATGAYGYTNTYDNNAAAQLGWTGTITLTVPLFDHLTTYSTYRTQVAIRRTAELTLEQAERDARTELASAQSAFRHAYESSIARSRTAELARHLYTDNHRRFEAGRISTDDLSIDEQRLYEAELLDVDGWAATHLAYSRLCHAVGKKLADCARD